MVIGARKYINTGPDFDEVIRESFLQFDHESRSRKNSCIYILKSILRLYNFSSSVQFHIF